MPVKTLRIYDSVRTAHLERFRVMTPADVVYRRRRYDFDVNELPDGMSIRQLGRTRTVLLLLLRSFDAVEINEPLMTERWLDGLLIITALRLVDRLRGRRTVIATYCIGVTDPADTVSARSRMPRSVATVWTRFVIRALVARIDRLAFGTQESLDLLGRYVPHTHLAARARLFAALPMPCDCATGDDVSGLRQGDRVLFLGAFNKRKGVRLLMAAWPDVPPGTAHLLLIGTGPLADEVVQWAADRPEVEVVVDPPRSQIHRALREAHVVVLPSRRIGGWREQVGLPIVEGLAHGCEIVTTDETGLVSWLVEHGHHVIAENGGPRPLARALGNALRATRTPADVVADLPAQDGRLAADAWLLGAPPGRVPERERS